MSNKWKLLLATLLYCANTYAQPMHKAWDYRYGGTEREYFTDIKKTNDGGYVLCGDTYSKNDGDKTQTSWGNGDGWIIKLDSNGIKQWDKRFGGTHYDVFASLIPTSDNGFIAAGYTLSGANGDISETPRGGVDYWLVKIDSDGNKLWDRRYGGNNDEYLRGNIINTSDGGYIMGGNSNSNVSGDKSESVRGSSLNDDYWVVKIDSLGNKQWDKTYGGFGQETMKSILQTLDGGYLIGGYSNSGISEEKTEENIGGFDSWLVKIDSTGNKIWDKSYGTISPDGIYSMSKTHDENYYILGGGSKYIKISKNGDLVWQKLFLGCSGTNHIELASDYGFIVSGSAYDETVCSVSAPDKTEDNLGRIQTWFVKTDSAFNKQWDKTVFSTGEDYEGKAIEAGNGCYMAASSSISWVGGYKSQPNWDTTNNTTDFWIVKLCEEPSLTPTLSQGEGVLVYPNPFVNEVAIRLEKEQMQEATYVLTTIDGKILFQQQENHLAAGYTKIWDLSPLPGGVYIITVNIAGENIVKRVVKE